MPAVLAEDLDHEIGESVDHLGLIAEAFGGVHHAQHLDDALDLVEAAEERMGGPEEIDAHLTRHLVAIFRGQVPPHLAARGGLAVDAAGTVAGEKEKIADPYSRHVVAPRLGWRGQGDAQLLDLGFRAHGDPSLATGGRSTSVARPAGRGEAISPGGGGAAATLRRRRPRRHPPRRRRTLIRPDPRATRWR